MIVGKISTFYLCPFLGVLLILQGCLKPNIRMHETPPSIVKTYEHVIIYGGRTIGIEGIRANLSDAFLDRVTSGKGRVVISASGANEVSSESDQLKQGIFTYYLLEGLKGEADIDKDGLVTVDEAFRFVSDHVPNATNQEQHPIRKGTVTGNFVLSVLN